MVKDFIQSLSFYFFRRKIYNQQLDFNVIDIDEDPIINISSLAASLNEDISTNTSLARLIS